MKHKSNKYRCGKPILGVAMAFALSASATAGAADNSELTLNIAGQNAGTALMELARRADVQIMIANDLGESVRVNPISGSYTLTAALDQMLSGTALKYEFRDDESVVIKKAAEDASGQAEAYKAGKEYVVEELIVTATKRGKGTSVQDTAMSISAFSGEDINRNSIVGMGDYLSTVPGVSQADFGVSHNRVSMRGLAASVSDETTVGIYLGEVPLSLIGGNGFSVDTKLVDMERIEVLRGPQGTLFGAGTMGGAVRNIPKAPDLTGFEAKFNVGFSHTDHASGANNSTTGVINVPLVEDQLALRLVGYRYDNQGYTELVSASDPGKAAAAALWGAEVVDQKGVGDSEFTGGRATLLWKPVDDLSVTLMHVTQDLEQIGFNAVDISKGGYKDVAFGLNGHYGGTEFLGEKADFTNLVIEYDMGWGSLVSSSIKSSSSSHSVRDVGRIIPLPLPELTLVENKGFIQEVRLSSTFDSPLQFLVGVYYEDLERTFPAGEITWGGNDALLPFTGLGSDPDGLLSGTAQTLIEQKAIFGEVSYDITEELTFTAGGRWFEYDRRESQDFSGTLGTAFIDESSKESDFRGKTNISYTPDENTLIYAQWAQGFRLGKPVPVPPLALCDVDDDGILDGTSTPINTSGALKSDGIDSYELGGKFTLLDDRFVVNAALYHIDWQDIPVAVFALGGCGFGTHLNAGNATSRGVEMESSYFLTENLSLNVGASYNSGELSEDAPGLGQKGDRLPLAPRFNGNLGLEYAFNLAGYNSFVRVNFARVGAFHSDLQQLSPVIAGYNKLNLRAGITVDNFDIQLYGTNLTGSDALATYWDTAYRIAPRQIGLDVGYRF